MVGNHQKAGVFWERIAKHYNANLPDGVRPLQSLETKWGLIKHNVLKFCGIYNQIQRMHKSGSSVTNTLRDAKELYRQKMPKIQILFFSIVGCYSKTVPAGLTDGRSLIWGRSGMPMSAREATHKV